MMHIHRATLELQVNGTAGMQAIHIIFDVNGAIEISTVGLAGMQLHFAPSHMELIYRIQQTIVKEQVP